MGPGGAAQGLGHPVSFSRLALSGAKAKARVPNHLISSSGSAIFTFE